MSPNDYRRSDVVKLARIIDPVAWSQVAVTADGEDDLKTSDDYRRCSASVSVAAKILVAGYRDCTI